MINSPLQQWLQHLEQLHPRDVDLGLERVGRVARELGLLPLRMPVVTVAGTNGKGSTVAVMEAVLRAAGRSVGAFTSPHLERFNERIRVDAAEVEDGEIVDAFEAIDAARGEVSLTYFEFSALAALWVFRLRAPDVVLLEVGLGGRLDAVNIVDGQVAVITAIDLDHQDWLGASRDAIGREKAGILRAGAAAVIADREPPASLIKAVAAAGAQPALFFGREFGARVQGETCRGWLWQGGERRQLPQLCCGPLVPDNVLAALQALSLLGVEVDDKALPAVVARAAPEGRRQCLHCDGVDYVLDVAHNPAAVDKLLEFLGSNPCAGKTIAVFSAMNDKDIEAMTARACGQIDAWFLADQPDNARAAPAEGIARVLYDAGQGMVSISRNLRQALARAHSIAAPGDRVVVFGSFSTVGAALQRLRPAALAGGSV